MQTKVQNTTVVRRGGWFSWVVCVALVATGFGISSYLQIRSLKLQQAEAISGSDVCSAVFGSSCDETLRNPWARQFGISLAGWGIVYFGGIGALLAMGYCLRSAFLDTALLTSLLAACVTLPVSAILVWVMLRGDAAVCPLCIAIHTLNALLPLTLLWAFRPPRRRVFQQLLGGMRFIFGKDDQYGDLRKWQAIGLLCAALFSLVLYQAVMLQELLHQPDREQLLWKTLLEYEQSERVKIPLAENAPRLGTPDADAELIVFSDFRCPSCRRFAATLLTLHAEFDDQLTIIFKHFPLEAVCNPFVTGNQHPGACYAASVAQAANNQDRFWTTHDQLFRETDPLRGLNASQIAQLLDLDSAQFADDMQSEVTRQRIKADIQDGQNLEIAATPAVFLNGARVHDLRYDTLRGMITLEACRRATDSSH